MNKQNLLNQIKARSPSMNMQKLEAIMYYALECKYRHNSNKMSKAIKERFKITVASRVIEVTLELLVENGYELKPFKDAKKPFKPLKMKGGLIYFNENPLVPTW